MQMPDPLLLGVEAVAQLEPSAEQDLLDRVHDLPGDLQGLFYRGLQARQGACLLDGGKKGERLSLGRTQESIESRGRNKSQQKKGPAAGESRRTPLKWRGGVIDGQRGKHFKAFDAYQDT